MYSVLPASLDDVRGAIDIDPPILLRIAPDSRLACRVNDRAAALCGGSQTSKVANVTRNRVDVLRCQMTGARALESNDFIPEYCKLAADCGPKKTATTGNQDFQWLFLHLVRSPLSQFFASDLGVVAYVHRKTRMEQYGTDAPGY